MTATMEREVTTATLTAERRRPHQGGRTRGPDREARQAAEAHRYRRSLLELGDGNDRVRGRAAKRSTAVVFAADLPGVAP